MGSSSSTRATPRPSQQKTPHLNGNNTDATPKSVATASSLPANNNADANPKSVAKASSLPTNNNADATPKSVATASSLPANNNAVTKQTNDQPNSHHNGDTTKSSTPKGGVEGRARTPSARLRNRERSARPRTGKVKAMGMEMTREKTMGLRREKTMGLKRQKTSLLAREKTIFDKSRRHLTQTLKGKQSHGKGDVFKVHPVFIGDITTECPSTAKMVRIFTSSTFKDTLHERDRCMTDAYPSIKRFCLERGYAFQVVDMRWGIRDEATDSHATEEICMQEIRLCQKLSTGPNFVTLMSHRYGNRSLQRVIFADEFENLFAEIINTEAKDLLKKWYRRDDNNVPPIYVLSPVSHLIPNKLSPDKALRKVASAQWWEQMNIMYSALEEAAWKILPEKEARNYTVSVSEKEIQLGLVEANNPDKECFWVKRNIKDIKKKEPSNVLQVYMECMGDEHEWKKPQQLLDDLKDKRMSKILPSANVLDYTVNWEAKGVDPECPAHEAYLSKMIKDFVQLMCTRIDKAIKENAKSHKFDPLFEECIEHILFCQEKSAHFHGRVATLEKITQYVRDDSNTVLVVHGMSGSGKTSLMAMVAKLVPSWIPQTAAVILRFIGTTPNSSNVVSMLRSILRQIKLVYAKDTKVPEELSELTQELEHCLRYADVQHPLIILLDSLDQLDSSHNAKQLQWLPIRLPPYVKVIVSTLEEEEHQCFQRLQTFISSSSMIAVPKLPANDVSGIIKLWLDNKKRCLTPKQRQILLSSFDQCPLPLFLKLSFDEACRWQSYDDVSVTILQKTVRASIDSLFQRLEVLHGEYMVSRALGYLTVARNGLSESELEDILSCDDEVLNDVYQYWYPPIRRVPPLLPVRLRIDLQQYIVEREADSVRVMQWYHRQFIEAARARYCTKSKVSFLHSQLAEFFSGKWANGNKKPYKDTSGKSGSSDRLCAPQPLQFGDTYNIRKMNNLPFHWLHAGNLQMLKEECLCNFEFLQTKMAAISVRELVDDFDNARRIFPNDTQLHIIGEAIQLSEDDMIYDPYMFPGQMLDRLAGEKNVTDFLKQCESCSHPHLRPSQEVLIKPGGQMLYAMAGHKGPVRSLDLKGDGTVALTCCEDGDDEIRTWDVHYGRMIRCYEELGRDPLFVSFVNNDEFMLIQFGAAIKVINAAGDIVYSIDTPSPMFQLCIGGPGKTLFGIFIERNVDLYSAKDGKKLTSVAFDAPISFGSEGMSAGSSNYMVVSDTDQQHLAVFSIKSKTFTAVKQVMVTDPDGEYKSIDALAISYDEKHVYFADSWTNDVHICEIGKLKETAVKKGSPDDYCLNFHIANDGKRMYYSTHKDFVVMDIASGKRTHQIEHPCNITDVRTVDLRKVVSITEDTCVRVWDVTKPVKVGDIQKYYIGYNIWSMKPLPNSRYIAVLFKRSEKDLSDFSFGVYDIGKDKMVRQANLDESPSVLEVLDNTYAILNMGSRRLKVINMDTLEMTSMFEGKLHSQEDTAFVVQDNTGIIVRSRNKHNIKLYDIETGKTKRIFKGESSMCQISKFVCSKSGDMMVAKVDEGPIIVYNIKSNSKSVINAKLLKVTELGSLMCVSSKDYRVVISGNKMVASSGEQNEEHVAIIWDTKKNCVIADLVDKEYFIQYMTKDNRKGLSISVDEVMCVNDTDVVSAHDDYIMRVWDLCSGELLHRLMGHTSNIEMFSVDLGAFFLTYGCWEEENALRLWDTVSFTCVASFKLDNPIAKAVMCEDGLSFVTNTVNPARIIHWKLHGVEPIVNLSLEKELFKGERVIDLDLQSVEDYDDDEGDPDSDIGDSDIDDEDAEVEDDDEYDD